MGDDKTLELLHRITNCLQTILELEPQFERLDLGPSMVKEFDVLKTFLRKVERLDLKEEDVARIETATASFLAELKVPLSVVREEEGSSRMMQ